MSPKDMMKVSNKIDAVTRDFPCGVLIPVFAAHLIECAMVNGTPPSQLRHYFNHMLDQLTDEE
jgi:hypothetical protein